MGTELLERSETSESDDKNASVLLLGATLVLSACATDYYSLTNIPIFWRNSQYLVIKYLN
jgi:hypothetical protein